MTKLSVKDLPRESASLREIQKYVAALTADRGFSMDVNEEFILLTEEIGELAKALRKFNGYKFDTKTHETNLREEFADVLIVLLGLANITEIDMYAALIEKEKINLSRRWNIVKDKEEN